MSDRYRRDERRSTARRRAEMMSTGFTTSTMNLPENMHFYEVTEGLHQFDVLPYIVRVPQEYVAAGDIHYERTYWSYRKIGIDEKSYICASKTFGHPDPIQDERRRLSKDTKADPQLLKDLDPKQRQLFLVVSKKDPDKGIQLLDMSYHNFGKKLEDSLREVPVERGWDFFYFPDEKGFTLEVSFKKQSKGGFSFLEAVAIYFLPRHEPLPERYWPENHKLCLDDFPKETPYDELLAIYKGVPLDQVRSGDGGTSGDGEGAERREPFETKAQTPPSSNGHSAQSEPPVDQRKAGYAAFLKGRTRADNPWKRGTDQYGDWLEGWLEAMEKEPAPTKEGQELEKPKITLAKGMVVLFNGRKHEVRRISDDGREVTMFDEADEVVKAAVGDVVPFQEGMTTSTTAVSQAEVKSETKSAEAGDKEDDWESAWKQ